MQRILMMPRKNNHMMGQPRVQRVVKPLSHIHTLHAHQPRISRQ